MSDFYVIPTDFNAEALKASLSDIFGEPAQNETVPERYVNYSTMPTFKNPLSFVETEYNEEMKPDERYFLSISQKSTRSSHDLQDQIAIITKEWDSLKKEQMTRRRSNVGREERKIKTRAKMNEHLLRSTDTLEKVKPLQTIDIPQIIPPDPQIEPNQVFNNENDRNKYFERPPRPARRVSMSGVTEPSSPPRISSFLQNIISSRGSPGSCPQQSNHAQRPRVKSIDGSASFDSSQFPDLSLITPPSSPNHLTDDNNTDIAGKNA